MNIPSDETILNAISLVLDHSNKKATIFQDANTVATCTALHKPHRGQRSRSFMLTIGRPNFEGRKLVKRAMKNREKFPMFSMVVFKKPAAGKGKA